MGKVQSLPVSLPFAPHEIPSLRIGASIANRSNKNLAFVVGGGIGDRICAEPTLSFALDTFRDCKISLICETPELFAHLKFEEVFDMKRTFPINGRHLLLNTYPLSGLFNQFVNVNLTHCVDYPSLAALRMQLPLEYKRVTLEPARPKDSIGLEQAIVIHPGKTWPSRTLPAWWWDQIIYLASHTGYRVLVVGNQTVELTKLPRNVVDLRGTTSISNLAWICMEAHAVVTNDSAPLHLAAPGDARIAYLSTCRNGELLQHHRAGGLGWRMKDFCTREIWREYNFCPNHLEGIHISELPSGVTIESLLSKPVEVINWILNER